MRLVIELAASVPKDVTRPDLNEDAWAIPLSGDRLAVSDGASESYDSRGWARLLVDRYVWDNKFSADWLADAVSEYLASINFESLSWAQQAAFERGSFATLLGAELAPNGHDLEILAIGDSLAVHTRAGKFQNTFPFSKAEEFDVRPQLLSTVSKANQFIWGDDFFRENSCHSWQVEEGDLLFLVTDAVGHWMLNEAGRAGVSPTEQLSTLENEADFSALVLQLRSERRIRLDDSTLVRVRVSSKTV